MANGRDSGRNNYANDIVQFAIRYMYRSSELQIRGGI